MHLQVEVFRPHFAQCERNNVVPIPHRQSNCDVQGHSLAVLVISSAKYYLFNCDCTIIVLLLNKENEDDRSHIAGVASGPRLSERTMRGIALETSALIRSGHDPGWHADAAGPGHRTALGVSPATVSSAWGELRRHNVISGRGRNGVWVCGDKIAPRPSRFETIGNFGDHVIDLTVAVPDPALLPPLDEALLHGTEVAKLNSYVRVPILETLQKAAEKRWPYKAEAYLATNGGYDAVYVTLQALVMPGSVVAIENPTAMRLLDILDNLGAHIVPVTCDEEGPCPHSLAEALRKKPCGVHLPTANPRDHRPPAIARSARGACGRAEGQRPSDPRR